MFLSQEIDIKLCQIYTKIYIYIKFCKNFVKICIQQIHNQSENSDFPEEPKKLRFAPILYIKLFY